MIRDTLTQKCKQYGWLWMSRGEVLPYLISMMLPVASISVLEAGSQKVTERSADEDERISRPRLGGGSRRQAGGLRRLTLNCEWRRPCSRPIPPFTPTTASSTFVLYPCIQHAHQHADRTRASAKSQVNGILAYLAQRIPSLRQSSHRLQAKGCLDRIRVAKSRFEY